MEISTDGGVTWAVVWTDTSQNNGDTYSPSVDLSAYDGMSNVQLGIRFYGTWAQEWWVDNVLIDGSGSGAPVYSATGLVGGGTATLTVTGATAGGGVLLGYSLTGAGPTNTPFGPVDMSAPITTLPTLTADGAGMASMTTGVPTRASGFTVYTQGADLTSGVLTNSLAEHRLLSKLLKRKGPARTQALQLVAPHRGRISNFLRRAAAGSSGDFHVVA